METSRTFLCLRFSAVAQSFPVGHTNRCDEEKVRLAYVDCPPDWRKQSLGFSTE